MVSPHPGERVNWLPPSDWPFVCRDYPRKKWSPENWNLGCIGTWSVRPEGLVVISCFFDLPKKSASLRNRLPVRVEVTTQEPEICWLIHVCETYEGPLNTIKDKGYFKKHSRNSSPPPSQFLSDHSCISSPSLRPRWSGGRTYRRVGPSLRSITSWRRWSAWPSRPGHHVGTVRNLTNVHHLNLSVMSTDVSSNTGIYYYESLYFIPRKHVSVSILQSFPRRLQFPPFLVDRFRD